MNLLIILKVALRSLRRTLMRSILTTLGIIIGVGSVIAMLSIGNGVRAEVEKSLSSIDTTQISLYASVPMERMRAGVPFRLSPSDQLTLEDAAAVAAALPNARVDVTADTSGISDIKANGRQSSVRMTASGVVQLRKTLKDKIVQGSGFGEIDVERAAPVCLISETIAHTLFDYEEAVGRQVRLGKIPFTVVGVILDDDKMAQFGGDTRVIIPYTTVLQRINPKASVSIFVYVDNPLEVEAARKTALDVLEQRRGTRKSEFRVGSSMEMVEQFKQGSQAMSLLLGAIGSISLLVGGIGIMNIMLVSVTERTREIGIRLAIGTRGRDVLRQFLIEAVILSLLGGVIGVLLGAGAAKLIGALGKMPIAVSPGSVLGAFLCSAAIGVFFGYYPARQAARLDPIQALRAE